MWAKSRLDYAGQLKKGGLVYLYNESVVKGVGGRISEVFRINIHNRG
jgi:hypothetical protein